MPSSDSRWWPYCESTICAWCRRVKAHAAVLLTGDCRQSQHRMSLAWMLRMGKLRTRLNMSLALQLTRQVHSKAQLTSRSAWHHFHKVLADDK